MKCGECQHWHRQIDLKNLAAEPVGQCRAMPPQLLMMPYQDGVKITPYFPLLKDESPTCGQYVQAEAELPIKAEEP